MCICGRRQHLAMFSPVQIHQIRPGSHAKMLAKAEPFAARAHRTKLGPSPHRRILSVSTHDPLVRNSHVSRGNNARIQLCNARAPMENYARLDCALDQQLMQLDPPQCESRRVRKFCIRGRFAAGKPDSSEMGRRYRNSDGCRGSVARQLLAATIPLRKVCPIGGVRCRKQSFAALFDSPRSPSRSPPDPLPMMMTSVCKFILKSMPPS